MTGGQRKKTVLVLANNSLFYQVREQLNGEFFLHKANSTDEAFSLIRRQPVLSVIIKVNEDIGYTPPDVSLFARQFPTIPVIAVVEEGDFELMVTCITYGAKQIVTTKELSRLKEKLFLLTTGQQLRGGDNHLLDTSKCSPLVKEAVKIIEEKYCQLKSAQTVADILGVKLTTLSRRFSKECSVCLWKYIQFLKIREAVFLMENQGLRLVDIAKKTGFTDKLQFNRCFKRLTGMSPQEIRERNLEIDLDKIFGEKVKKCG